MDTVVLGQAVEVQVGDERAKAGADAPVVSPKGVPHGLYNPGPVPFRLLVLKVLRH